MKKCRKKERMTEDRFRLYLFDDFFFSFLFFSELNSDINMARRRNVSFPEKKRRTRTRRS